jgi:hypothetical protein
VPEIAALGLCVLQAWEEPGTVIETLFLTIDVDD